MALDKPTVAEAMHTATTVVALGGNALAGDHPLDYPELDTACRILARQCRGGLVITHGNGPQVGRLTGMMCDSPDSVSAPFTPLDMAGAESEGLLGYAIEQALSAYQDAHKITTVLTRVEVQADDPALNEPVKPIGPWLDMTQARKLTTHTEWYFTEQDGRYRRLVASPDPIEVIQSLVIENLLAMGQTVICTGGGGVPVIRRDDGHYEGVEAVVDKDRASALLATQLKASLLVLATDVDGVYCDWETQRRERIREANPEEMLRLDLPPGSMGAKVESACQFVKQTGKPAVIGALEQLEGLLSGSAGTRITPT